jgi:hypothetical protein
MRRRLFPLAAAFALLATSLTFPTVSNSGSCEECRETCNSIPMATEDCLELYCPECAGPSAPVGGDQPGSGLS